MTHLHICPLSQVPERLASSGAQWTISLLARTYRMPDLGTVASHRRLHLPVSDITKPTADHVIAERGHVDALVAFLARWDRTSPLLIHCYAGVSRSTAAAFVALCCLDPETPEADHARTLRAASPTATPNRRIVELADAVLGRDGRMLDAVAAIGRGTDCFEGVACAIPVPLRRDGEARLDGRPSRPA